MMRKLFLLFVVIYCFYLSGFAEELLSHPKTRVVILTDICDEPDEKQSLVRFLTYSNMFDIEGIIATTSYWLPDVTRELKIMSVMRAYGKMQKNLSLHEDGFPTTNELLRVSMTGKPVYGKAGLGHYANSEGSMSILNTIRKDDDRPIWILIWGGSNTLAQALWRLDFETNDEDFARYTQKLRVYAISDQDDTGLWIRNNYPNIFYICSPGYAHDGKEGYRFATWSGISGERFYNRKCGANSDLVLNEWIKNNIQENHGDLGEAYPNVKQIMEGNTPSFLYLINNGLGSPDHPDYGSWGGRYEYYTPPTQDYFWGPESNPLWTDAKDDVISSIDGKNYVSNHATIWRWREDFQNDFAARMDWCVKSYSDANHPPHVTLGMDSIIAVHPNDTVKLISGNCIDPDGDKLNYEWIYYREVGNSVYNLTLRNKNSKNAWFIAPDLSHVNTMHFILRVVDDGEPNLARYKRVIVNVEPKEQKPRVIVTTDGEIDDKSSFVRFLMYANEFETEGLIYGNSKWQPNGNGIMWMKRSIDQYAKCYDNLIKHDPDYPSPEELIALTFDGNRNVNYLHSHQPIRTVGAQHIIDVLLDKDPRPVWVQAWGGTNTLAHALAILKKNYLQEDVEYALTKLKVFAIADQDSTGEWIRKQFPEVFYIRSYQFTALNYQHEGHLYSDAPIFGETWTTTHVKENHGDLGASYPQKYFSEGDSPAFLHLINNGLRANENPSYGGWGGRYETQNGTQFYDAADNGDYKKGQWRWLLDIQNDFKARMDWCVSDFDSANHYPEIYVDKATDIEVKSGEKVSFNASKSTDPDGNNLKFEWYFYADASTCKVMPKLKNNRNAKFDFTCPQVTHQGTIHLLLEVSDDGIPAMKKYKRFIVTVIP